MKRFNTITCVTDADLKTSAIIAREASMAAFSICSDLPLGIALSGTCQLFSLASAITQKKFKIFIIKQKKRDVTKLLVQSK